MLKMSADNWAGAQCNEEESLDPGWDAVAAAIRRLDANARTSVYLERNGAYLAVNGGRGRYVVFAGQVADENDDEPGEGGFFTLIDPDGDPLTRVYLVAAGQPGLFAAWSIIALDPALKAAEVFAATGTRDPSQAWTES